MKRLAPVLFLVLLAPAASGTSIAWANITVDLGSPDRVEITRHYDSITTDRISHLASGRYEPSDLSARDGRGALDCEVDRLDIGREILCDPRNRSDYTVTISYQGELTEERDDGPLFTYSSRFLVPTDRTRFRVVLPEGFGLRSNGDAYAPGGAEVGSEGRRIFVQWTANVSLGDAIDYSVRYEELDVLENIALRNLSAILFAAVLVLAGAVVYVWRRRSGDGETIASVFPVLKDDEKEVLRYVIDREGEVEQREIVDSLDYSKAKISRLVSDLEERNLIEKEKRGRVNVVSLAREVGDLNEG